MEELLIECCEKMINLLNNLKENGSITQEEFENHIEIKHQFIYGYILSKYKCTYSSVKQS